MVCGGGEGKEAPLFWSCLRKGIPLVVGHRSFPGGEGTPIIESDWGIPYTQDQYGYPCERVCKNDQLQFEFSMFSQFSQFNQFSKKTQNLTFIDIK